MNAVSSWEEQVNKASDHIDFDTLCKTLNIPSWSERHIPEYEVIYSDATDFSKFVNVVESVALIFFGYYYLDLECVSPGQYRISPMGNTSWRQVAARLCRTIKDFGMFYFSSTQEFLDSGPYTAKQAVLNHLHWIAEHSAVYGDQSPHTLVEDFLSYKREGP